MLGICNLSVHETLLIPVLMYGSETMLRKERSMIRAVQMYNLRGLLGIMRRMGKSTECMNKGVVWSEERIDEGVLWWFIHVERIENVRIAKRVYVGKYW